MTKPKSHWPPRRHNLPWKTLQNTQNLNISIVLIKLMMFISSEIPCRFLIRLMIMWCIFNGTIEMLVCFSYKFNVPTPKQNMSKWSRSRFNQKDYFWIEVVNENRLLFGGPQKSNVWIPRRHVRVIKKRIEFIWKIEVQLISLTTSE